MSTVQLRSRNRTANLSLDISHLSESAPSQLDTRDGTDVEPTLVAHPCAPHRALRAFICLLHSTATPPCNPRARSPVCMTPHRPSIQRLRHDSRSVVLFRHLSASLSSASFVDPGRLSALTATGDCIATDEASHCFAIATAKTPLAISLAVPDQTDLPCSASVGARMHRSPYRCSQCSMSTVM
jgi:hypothetical protein